MSVEIPSSRSADAGDLRRYLCDVQSFFLEYIGFGKLITTRGWYNLSGVSQQLLVSRQSQRDLSRGVDSNFQFGKLPHGIPISAVVGALLSQQCANNCCGREVCTSLFKSRVTYALNTFENNESLRRCHYVPYRKYRRRFTPSRVLLISIRVQFISRWQN